MCSNNRERMNSVYDKILSTIPIPDHKKHPQSSKKLGNYHAVNSKQLGMSNKPIRKRLGIYF